MKYRGQFDGTAEVVDFADKLEKACIDTVEQGDMTKDLALLIGKDQKYLTTEEFMDKVAANLESNLKN